VSAPRKVCLVQPVRIRSERRLAAGSELNPAPGRVTGHREARGMGYRATTQVTCLRATHRQTVARYQTDESGTRETHDVPARVWANKPPVNGKEAQMASWESDQLIVVLKQGNACGAKGLAGEPRSRDTFSGLRTGPRKSTRLHDLLDGG